MRFVEWSGSQTRGVQEPLIVNRHLETTVEYSSVVFNFYVQYIPISHFKTVCFEIFEEQFYGQL